MTAAARRQSAPVMGGRRRQTEPLSLPASPELHAQMVLEVAGIHIRLDAPGHIYKGKKT